MSHIFLSYASEDRDRIMPVVRALQATGLSVFWDRTIPVGATWQKIVGTEIEACGCMVVIWSSTSINKEWVYEEASEGKRRGVLAPVLIDNIFPPIGFRGIQAAHLEGWDGKAASAEFDQLVKDISLMLGTSAVKSEEQEEKKQREEVEARRRAEQDTTLKAEAPLEGRKATESAQLQGERRRAEEDESSRGAADLLQIVGRELYVREHKSRIGELAVSADGRVALSSSAGEMIVWDVRTGCKLRTLRGHAGSPFPIALSGDGGRAVSSCVEEVVLTVWNVATGRKLRTLEGHTDLIVSVAVSEDGRRAFSGSADNTLKMWDLESGRTLHTLERSGPVNDVAVTPDGKRVVSSSAEKTVQVWDVEAGRELYKLGGGRVAASRDGRRAVTAFKNKRLKVWDVETGCELRTLEGRTNVYGLAVSRNGRLVCASEDKMLKVWDAKTGALIITFTFAKDMWCAFIGDDQLAAGGDDGRLHFLRLEGLNNTGNLQSLP